jgi:hypothetical protein
MQTAEVLITDLWRRGVQIESKGDRLSVRPLSRLSESDTHAIRALKGELLALLNDPYARARAVARHCEANGVDLSTFLSEHPDLIRDEVSAQERRARTPAESIVAACRKNGVALRIDPETGDLVVGRAGAGGDAPTQPWPSLLLAIEAHLDAVITLVKAGWTLSQPFVNGQYVH